MQAPDLIRLFVEPLEKAGFEYMITGSVATILYGEPRLTHDVDLVVAIRADQAETFSRLFAGDDFYCPPSEIIAAEASRGAHAHFNLLHVPSGYKADIYPVTESLQRWGLGNRHRVELGGGFEAWIAPPEYVILMKLAYFAEGGSQKHLTDIRGVLSLKGAEIDLQLVQRHAAEMGLEKIWAKLAASI